MKDSKLLIALAAASVLLLYTLIRTAYSYRSLNYAKRIGHFVFIISFSLLTAMYAIKYFIADFKIPFLLVAVVLLAPLFLYQLLERREKQD